MSSFEPTVAVIILAGGYSRRMGQDKALLRLPDGRSLLAHTYQVAAEITPQVVVVTPWPARYREVLPSATTFITEPAAVPAASLDESAAGDSARQKPSRSPLHGFAYGWQRIAADWCLLLACDMPYLEPAALRRWWTWLMARAEKPVPTATDTLPTASLVRTARGWHPLCGFYHRRGLPSLLHYQASQQCSFQPWLRTVPVLPYAELSPNLLFNCNTPDDWRHVVGSAYCKSCIF